ncbi:hypothetical protein FW784_13445 [Lysobacter lacus]|uniref:DUF4145 domain-containing protein n=2 Tax=Cognatilysobacter lacus TaxID=1643323 RepID=A0A5D8YNX9_9GAMM|nr:hypothetical protein FW784_13445 [Lysobacter lacus]
MDTSIDRDFGRIQEHFPDGADMTLQVLKGHLLVEELIREIFGLLLTFPDALRGERGTRFECHQVICLVQAISPHSASEPWIWDAAKRLNGIRNDLAHNLEPRAVDEKIKSLIQFVSSAESVKPTLAKNPPPEGLEFKAVILCMCGGLTALKDLIRKDRGSAP